MDLRFPESAVRWGAGSVTNLQNGWRAMRSWIRKAVGRVGRAHICNGGCEKAVCGRTLTRGGLSAARAARKGLKPSLCIPDSGGGFMGYIRGR